ncbi:MAG: 16S rRNA pseudouridine(516) synthase [Oscillospiraceae bacterium]|nr:16S rRNA pseudouridine(516) synthase [Oscillospiraceae bacterium]
MERLDKLLSGTGRWTRKQVKELIRTGRVTVDGVPAARPEQPCSPAARVQVDVPLGPVYIMLHKPAGLLSATEDARQETVLELLPEYLRRAGLFPVGRLDKDTEGLLLLTNDGALAHRLLSPRAHVDKVYFVRADGPLSREDALAFAAGLTLEDGTVCKSAVLEPLETSGEALITIREGKYHQIKRMLAQRGRRVEYLKRLSMGPLDLDPALVPGQWRFLTPQEQKLLEYLLTATQTAVGGPSKKFSVL